MKATLLLASLANGEQVATSVNTVASANPVSKVITLIKDMMKQLDKEAEEDEDMYDKLSCWCHTYNNEKTKAVKDGETAITQLTASIEQMTGRSAQLHVEIKNLKKEVAMNQNAMDQATAIRLKQRAEYAEEDKTMAIACAGIESSIKVLKKSMGNFLQIPNDSRLHLHNQLEKAVHLGKSFLTHTQQKMVLSLMQEETPALAQTHQGAKSKTRTKSDVFGVLEAMKESFEKQMAEAKVDDKNAEDTYQALKKAKNEEIQAGTDQADMKTQELASTDEKLAESIEGKSDTEKSLAADQKFLVMLTDKCSQTDAEWEERQKTRSMEIEACSKALAVLNSDAAQDLFTKTFTTPSFMQVQKKQESKRRVQASVLLKNEADKLHSPRLAAVAMRVKLDAFTKVKQSIDDMVTQLGKEKQDEIAHRDFCVKEFNENTMETEQKERDRVNLLSSIDDLNQSIKTLAAEINTLKTDMNEMSTNLKRAGEDRELENVEFQKAVSDQRASIRLLTAALEILKGFYEKTELLQLKSGKQAPPAPAGFKEYKKDSGNSGVMQMIGDIVAEAKQMEADTIRAEEDAQKTYEEFVKDTNENLGIKSEESVNKNEEKAKAEKDLNQATMDKDNTMLLLEQLSNRNAELHKSCDFIMKNFDIRQEARDEEINALRQAKDILSGAKFQALLQQP